MTDLSTTAKPSWALTCWVDDVNIYIEIPSTEGKTPYIQRFPIVEGGLSHALNFLRQRYELVPMAEKNYTGVEPGYVCKSTGASVVYRKQKKVVQTEVQRAVALNVLRKLGVV